jgi:hypothetical protein
MCQTGFAAIIARWIADIFMRQYYFRLIPNPFIYTASLLHFAD